MRQAVGVRSVQSAAILGLVWPVGDTLDTLLPTAIYISLVSLLDDALEQAINNRWPGSSPKNLEKRIVFLAQRNCLVDPSGLHRIRCLRNKFAHEVDQYASWKDVEELFPALDEEIRHLRLV